MRAEQLNDKALGRALDKLWDADAKRVYSTICFRAVEAYEVTLGRLHTNTTSIALEGAYEEQEPAGPKITRGFKDHRPDLLQFKVGATVTEDGIPLAGDVFAGNEPDQTWNLAAMTRLESWIGLAQRSEMLFVADSALVTNDNLEHLAQASYRFVSRLPDSYPTRRRPGRRRSSARRTSGWTSARPHRARRPRTTSCARSRARSRNGTTASSWCSPRTSSSRSVRP